MIKADDVITIPNLFSKFFWYVIDLFYPPFCCGCGKIGFEICPDCFSRIHIINPNLYCRICGDHTQHHSLCAHCNESKPFFNELRSWGIYEGTLKKAIHRFKYDRGFAIIDLFIVPLCHLISEWNIEFDFITPVPLSQTRQRKRGYNQSAMLARPISRMLLKPYIPNSLRRTRNTTPQVGLDANERKNNLNDAFVANQNICNNRSILLIDDIATTCTTLNECAKTMKKAGAKDVFCLTLGRALNKNF